MKLSHTINYKAALIVVAALVTAPILYAVMQKPHTTVTAPDRKLVKLAEKANPMVDSIPPDEENPYVLLVAEAEKNIADSNYTAAISRLKDAISIKPDHPANGLLWSNIGELYSRIGNDSLACVAYDEAIELSDENDAWEAILYGKRGRCNLRLNNDVEAYRDFGIVLMTDTLNGEALYFHGLISLFSGNLPAAERDFGKLKKYYPTSLAAAKALGMLYSMTEKDGDAIPYLQKVIKESPAPEYYSALAGCQLKLSRLTDASSTIGEGLRAYPGDPELYYYRAWLNRDLYRNREAESDAKEALRLGANPKKVNALFGK